jgi:hypothetical protein
VERAVPVTKNAAQVSNTAWGEGPRALVQKLRRRSSVFPACGTRFLEQMACGESQVHELSGFSPAGMAIYDAYSRSEPTQLHPLDARLK